MSTCQECQIFKEHFTVLREGFEKQKLDLEAERRARHEAKLEIDRLQAVLDESNDALKQVEHDRDSVAAQYNILKENCERIDDHANARRLKGSELNKIRQDSDKYIQAMEAELRAQAAKLRDSTDRCAALKQELAAEAARRSELQSDTVSLGERCRGLTEEGIRLSRQVDELQAAGIEKASEAHRLRTELEETRHEVEYFKEEESTGTERENKRREKALTERTAQYQELARDREAADAAHAAAEAAWRLQLQRERDECAARVAELADRSRAQLDDANKAAVEAQLRIAALREEAKALAADATSGREARKELEERRGELTAKCARLERAEAYARQEAHGVAENAGKLRAELDRARARVAEAKGVEAKLALVEVRLQYKEAELQEVRGEKQAAHLERGRAMAAMQKVVEKESRKLRRMKREQRQVLVALNDVEQQRCEAEQAHAKLKREYEGFRRHTEVREQAAAALAPGAAPVLGHEGGFVPDKAVFRTLAENYQKTEELEKLHAAATGSAVPPPLPSASQPLV